MENYMIFVWLGVIVLAIVTEALTAQLVSVWFVGGGLVGLLANALYVPPWPQVVIASVVTLILLIATRPFVKRKVEVKRVSTNADRYIGEKATVVEEINNYANQGQIKVKGNIWTARSEDDQVIPLDALVEVLRIEGVKMIVKE